MTIRDFKQISSIQPAGFARAHDLIVRSGAGTRLDELASAAAGVGGRPPTEPPYTATAILTGLLLLAMQSRPMTVANLLRLIWDELDEPMLATLGLDRLVTPSNAREMRNDKNARRRRYERLRKTLDRLVAPIDPSPHPRKLKEDNAKHRAREKALTDDQRAVLAARRALLLAVCNSIISASLPERPAHHDGSSALDGVIIEANAGTGGTGTRNGLPHGADPCAGWWVLKQKQNRLIWGYCLTLAIATHTLRGLKVLNVCTGMSIAKANGGDRDEALEALDATTANGWGARGGKHAPPVLIVDRGYSDKNGLAAAMNDRGWDQTIDYSNVTVAGSKEGQPPDPVQHTFPQGPLLYEGVVVCPGASSLVQPQAHPTTGEVSHHPGGTYDPRNGQVRLVHPGEPQFADPAHLLAHHQFQTLLAAHRMPINQRLTYQPNGGRPGRPSKNNPARPTRSLQVVCPAAAGLLRCPHCPASMLAPVGSIPDVHTPPAPDPDGNLPAACGTSTYVTLQLGDREVKRLQKHMHGSDDWADQYGGSRSRNEQYNSQLKDRNASAVDDDAFELTGTARVALLLSLAVATTNLAQAAAYDNKLFNGRPRPEDRRDQNELRSRVLAQAKDRLRGKDTTNTN